MLTGGLRLGPWAAWRALRGRVRPHLDGCSGQWEKGNRIFPLNWARVSQGPLCSYPLPFHVLVGMQGPVHILRD